MSMVPVSRRPLPTAGDQDGPRRDRACGWRAGDGDLGQRGVWPLAGRRLDILGRVMDEQVGGVSLRVCRVSRYSCARGSSSLLLSLSLLFSPVVAGLCESGGGLILGMKGEKIRPELHRGRSVPAKTFGQFLLGPSLQASGAPVVAPGGARNFDYRADPQFHGLSILLILSRRFCTSSSANGGALVTRRRRPGPAYGASR